jgi:hypothetical protein
VARRYALALLASFVASIVLASGAARAEWEANAKVERFRWAENTQPGVTETGPRFGIGAGWTQDRDSGWLLGWRGELYGGSVEYNGAELFPPNRPVKGTTEYTGFITELQGMYRPGGGNAALVSGLGFDYWNRQLTDVQKEEWYVVFARLGAELGNRARRGSGLFAAGGVKYPLYIVEDAHLNDIGFDTNPKLRPGRAPSLYAEVGYRFTGQWTVTGYYDSYRFRESPAESTSVGGAPFLVFQPESRADSYGVRLHIHF